ncbi:MAG: antitoxin family protein, partial [Chloroflexi bacterium]|nr:antitoxin family protein [Chloroflexota bacterium]
MPQVIKARYSKGVIEPLEKLDLREGEIILISVEQTFNP